MTAAWTLRLPQREGLPHQAPLLALSGDMLAAGTSEMIVTYALTARSARALRLASMRSPPGKGQFVALALEPGGTVLAVLAVDYSVRTGECFPVKFGGGGMCSRGGVSEKPILYLLVPETLRVLSRVELPSLPFRDMRPAPLCLCSRSDGRPGVLVVLPSLAVLLQSEGAGLCVERKMRLSLRVAAGSERFMRSRPHVDVSKEVRRAAEFHIAGAIAVHAALLPSVESMSEPRGFAAVCFDDGGMAIYEMQHIYSRPFEKVLSISGSPSPCSHRDEVPPLITYVGSCYRILAVSKVLRPSEALGAVAIALACPNRGADASEEPIGEREETERPPSVFPDSAPALNPGLCWVALSGLGETGSCELVQVVSGPAAMLVAEDYPLSCSISANGAVRIVSRRGAALTLYPDMDLIGSSVELPPCEGEWASDISPVAIASCVSSGSRLAMMHQAPAPVFEPRGDPMENYAIQVVASG